MSNPLSIEPTRWDPISGGASAVMATSVDMARSITGMVTKPMEERRIQRFRSEQRKGKDGASSTSSTSEKGYAKPQKDGGPVAAKMAGASVKSIANIFPTALKGMVVDFPLAITEGLKTVPAHYGGNVRDHGPVTGAKSGAVVAGKTFAWGMVDGVSDLFVQPYKGARDDGVVGAVKGLSKGAMNLVTKSGAGMFGVLAYNSQGIAKSVRSAFHGTTRKIVAEERRKEGEWLLKTGDINTAMVVGRFQEWKRGK
jgi:hypothetical protein